MRDIRVSRARLRICTDAVAFARLSSQQMAAEVATFSDCAHCGAPARQQCSACKSARFCSADHAKAGWKKHKVACKAIKSIDAKQGWVKQITKEGEGEPVGKGRKTNVHYVGTFANGAVFDSSRKRDKEFTFVPGEGRVIAGWDEAVPTMKVGERAMLYVLGDYAYGPAGSPPVIPPNATLVFDVEVISVDGASA